MKYDLLLTGATCSIRRRAARLDGHRHRRRQDQRGRALAACRGRAPHDQRQGPVGDAGAGRHPCPYLRQRLRHGWPHRPFLSGERRHHVVRCRQHRLGNLSRAASSHRPRGAHPDPRLRKSIGDWHRRHLARWRAIPVPYADPEGCARTISENPDLAIGVKLRYGPGLVWEYSPEPVKLARRTADMAGGVPMMMHITDSPIPLPELLAHMKAGDIVTHCYHGRAHGIMARRNS